MLAAQTDSANRIQHMYGRHAGVKGEGAYVIYRPAPHTSSQQRACTLQLKHKQSAEVKERLCWVILQFNSWDK